MNTPTQKPEAVNPATDANDSFPELSELRLSQEFLETAGAKKILTTVPVHKPRKQDFVRVHPDKAFREAFAIVELKDDRERYLITPDIAAALPTEIVTEMLYTAINRQRVVFLWPVRLPAPDGRVNEWHRSTQEAAEHAMHHWVRIVANMSLGAYEIIEAPAQIPDPEWPDCTFGDLLRIGLPRSDHQQLRSSRA